MRSQTAALKLAHWTTFGFLVAGLLSATGCQTMNFQQPPAETLASETDQFRIQMVPQFGRPTVVTETLAPGMTVQSALEAAGAVDKFRAMDITLSRILKDSHRVLKMPVSYSTKTRSVSPETDYALHPGDTLSVKAKSPGSLDKMLKAATGGML